MDSEYFKGEFHKITPVLDPDGSDSARLDNALEFFVMNGMPLPLAVMITDSGALGYANKYMPEGKA